MFKTLARATSFYWRSAKWAAKGTLERANAWFWPFGVPIVGGLNYWARGGKMTIPDHIPEFLLFMLQTVAISWVIFFIVRFFGAGPHFAFADAEIVAAQRQTIANFEKLHRPEIRVFLDEETHGVTLSPTEVDHAFAGGRMKGPLSKWAQFSVACGGEAPLKNCEAWLASVRRIEGSGLGSQLAEEQVNCAWSQIAATSITIQPGRTQRANLFSVLDREPPQVVNETRPAKLRLRDAIQTPGSYRIKILVTADDARSIERQYIFTWRDFQNVTLVPA